MVRPQLDVNLGAVMAELSCELASQIEQLKKTLLVVLVEETYDPDNFGNAALTMVGPEISIRLVRDRGQVFMDIAQADGEWVDANEILEAVRLHPRPGQSLEMFELTRLICANSGRIREFIA